MVELEEDDWPASIVVARVRAAAMASSEVGVVASPASVRSPALVSESWGVAVVLPVTAAPPLLDRLGFVGEIGGGSEPRVVCRPGPHPFYMAQVTGAHQPRRGWAPRSGTVKVSRWAVGPNGKRDQL